MSEEMDEKAVVRVDAEGNVAKCAKGAGDGCGYKAGAKVCGKCGAMAVQIKKAAMEDEDLDEEMDEKAVVRVDADGKTDCTKGAGCGYKAGAKTCATCGATAVQMKGRSVEMDEDNEDLSMDDEKESLKKGMD